MNYKHRLTSILILSLLMFAFALSPARADDDPDTFQVYGILEDPIPDYPGPGDWIVDGVTYTADNDTEFETDHGEFTAGACVEVKYFTSEGVNYAKEIESEYDYKCSGDSREYSETYGIVFTFPENLIGEWEIGEGIFYTADENTRFEQEHGGFFVGGCVEVKYFEEGGTKTAIEIETKSADKCDGEALTKFYGLIEEPIPDLTDYSSHWFIGGMEFKFNADTNLDQNKAVFAENVCVEVLYYLDAESAKVAKKIKSKNTHHCSKGSFTQIVYGTIESFPKDLYGTWVVDDKDYVASPSTQFKESVRKFDKEQCVKVKYYTVEGVNHAVEIKTEVAKKCDGSGEGLPGVSKIYATIDSFPWPPGYAGEIPYVGPWIIGSIEFIATEKTEYEQEHGSFAVGVCVEASYTTSDDGWNTLIVVATQEPYKCENDGDPHPSALVFTTYGSVVSIPENVDPTDLTGDWKINGASYIAGDFTNFSEEFGDFEIGAYVKVKYVLVTYNDMELARLALSIETHVAPDAGLINVQGTLTAHDSSDKVNDWVVDGVTYAADSAIEVGKNAQAPKVGQWVMLNAYEINDVQYVTSIQAPYYLFHPLISQ